MNKYDIQRAIANAINTDSIFNMDYRNADGDENSFLIGNLEISSEYGQDYFKAIVLDDDFEPVEGFSRTFRIDRIRSLYQEGEYRYY